MEIDLSTSFVKKYVLRFAAKKTPKVDYESLEITVPLEAAKRECRRLGLTTEQLAERYNAVWYMGSFPGLYLAFEEKEKPAEAATAAAVVAPGG